MKKLYFFLFITLITLCIGCLGLGGKSTTHDYIRAIEESDAYKLSGRVFFYEQSRYGGIPVYLKPAGTQPFLKFKQVVDLPVFSSALEELLTKTDPNGFFFFESVPQGSYDLFVSTGESEVKVRNALQIVSDASYQLQDTKLLYLDSCVISRITPTSLKLGFKTTHSAISKLSYSASLANTKTITINSSYSKNHEITLNDLTPDTRYSMALGLTSEDGQEFYFPGIYTTTAKIVGPTNLSVSINQGNPETFSLLANLELLAEGATLMRLGTEEDLTSKPWETYRRYRDFNLDDADGTKRVYVQFKDESKNESSVISDSILLVSDKNYYSGVWINDGEALTNRAEVVLTLLHPSATKMRISDSTFFANSFWEPFVSSKRWTLSSGDGEKTVYAQFDGDNVDSSITYKASIIYDTLGSQVMMSINDGAKYTNNQYVNVNYEVLVPPQKMQLSNELSFSSEMVWLDFVTPVRWRLPAEDGEKIVYSRFLDRAGNIFGPISAEIILDTKPPENFSFSINESATFTESLEVYLNIEADDAKTMTISNVADFSGAIPESFTTSKNWLLSGYGMQTVYIIVTDEAGNSTPARSQKIDSIKGKSMASVVVNGGDSVAASNRVTLSLLSEDALLYRVSENQNFYSAPERIFSRPSMETVPFDLSPIAGKKEIFVRFQNLKNEYSIANTSITLLGPTEYSFTTFEQQPLTNNKLVLRPFAENAHEMLITEDYSKISDESLWEPFAFVKQFILTPELGQHKIYAKYRNAGGVETPIMTCDVFVEEVVAEKPVIMINAGDAETSSSLVTINIWSTSAFPLLRLSNNQSFEDELDRYPVNQSWRIPNNAGEHTVYARFLNADSGEYYFTNATIKAVGPSEINFTTSDSLPLKNNYVNLELFAKNAGEMIVTESLEEIFEPTNWMPYKNSFVFPLKDSKSLTRTIYAIFRKSPSNDVLSTSKSLDLTIDSSVVADHTLSLRKTVDQNSEVITSFNIASLPVYLHFRAVNSTVFWQIAKSTDSVPSTFNTFEGQTSSIELTKEHFPEPGAYYVYYRYLDQLGNMTPLTLFSVEVLAQQYPDPTILINEGDTHTFSSLVQLKIISNPNYPVLRLSNTGSFSDLEDLLINDDSLFINWNLTKTPGVKTVFARFYNPDIASHFVTSASIEAKGPANATISTTDTMPLNSNIVNLILKADEAASMILTENVQVLYSNEAWIDYQPSFSFVLSKGGGAKTVYAKFRNASSTSYIESEPISLLIDVNNKPPSGNTVTLRAGATSTSTQVDRFLISSLPVFLHFSIHDSDTATISWNINRFEDSIPSDFIELSAQNPLPQQITTSHINSSGLYNFYYSFIDGVGNKSLLESFTVEVLPLPLLEQISINDADHSTIASGVTIRLQSNKAVAFAVSESPNFAGLPTSSFVPPEMLVDYYLSTVAGEKTVYVRFVDDLGEYTLLTDSILAVGPKDFQLKTSDSLPLHTNKLNLDILAEDAFEMIVTQDFARLSDPLAWIAYSSFYQFTLAEKKGVQILYCKLRNKGGIETELKSLTVEIASEEISGEPQIIINGGDTQTESATVLIEPQNVASYTQMWLSETGNFYGLQPLEVKSQNYQFASFRAGQKTLFARFYNPHDDSYFVTSALIEAKGPTNAAISTFDPMPLNSNILNLSLFANGAVSMLLTEDSQATQDTWIDYQTNFSFVLSQGGGTKTIYAKFRNASSTSYIETELVSLRVELNNEPPSGNTAVLRAGVLPNTEQLSNFNITSLPVFLHFSIVDADTATISWSIKKFDAPIPDTFLELSALNALPQQITESYISEPGFYNLYYRYADGVGNKTLLESFTFEVLPEPLFEQFAINYGDHSTIASGVILRLESNRAVSYLVAETPNFAGMVPLTFVQPEMLLEYNLTPSVGQKTLYARFTNDLGEHTLLTDSILAVGPTDFQFKSYDELPLSSDLITLEILAQDAFEMIVTQNYSDLGDAASWVSYSASYQLTLPEKKGEQQIYCKLRNRGGIETEVKTLTVEISSEVFYEKLPHITLNAGDQQTASSLVFVEVFNVASYPMMCLSETGNFYDALPLAAVSQNYKFSIPQAGERVLYARFQHLSGKYEYCETKITLIGPSNIRVVAQEASPINSNFVTLNLYAENALDMILSENVSDMTSSSLWVPYQPSKIFNLSAGGGGKIIYAKFRNLAVNYVESAPVTCSIDVLAVPPTGNAVSFRESALATSQTVNDIPVGSLPIYLHMSISNANTKKVFYALSASDQPMPASQNFEVRESPFTPIEYGKEKFPGNGAFFFYYSFQDGVGNQTATQAQSIYIKGPRLSLSPGSPVSLFSGETQRFDARLENITGTILWSLSPSSPSTKYGTVDTHGYYVAPQMINTPTETRLRAELKEDSSVYYEVLIKLELQIEVEAALKQHQVTINQVSEVGITFKNSSMGGTAFLNSPSPQNGLVELSPAVEFGSDMVATLTYTAPATLPDTNPVSVTIVSSENQDKSETVIFQINSGPWISIEPKASEIRLRTGSLDLSANISSDESVTWFVKEGHGSFSSSDPNLNTIATNSKPHEVRFYAPTLAPAVNPVKVVASFTEDGQDYSTTSSLTLTPPVLLEIAPKIDSIALASTVGLDFSTEVHNATTSEVIWSYRNVYSDETPQHWYGVGESSSPDTGILMQNGNNVIYYPPAAFPPGLIPGDKVEIKAASVDDLSATAIATVTLTYPLTVVLREGYDASGPEVSQTSVTLEVGNKQFFAEMQHAKPGSNITASWYVENILGGNSLYGTVQNGNYTAPDTMPQSFVTLKAVSNQDQSKYAECRLSLQPFWQARNNGLKNVAEEMFPVYKVLIDPTTPIDQERVIYAATNGFGLYRTTIKLQSGEYDWDDILWKGVTGLSTNLLGAGGKYVVNDIAISRQNPDRIVAATSNGAFLVTDSGNSSVQIDVPTLRSNTQLKPYDEPFTNIFSSVVIDPVDDAYMYLLGANQGLLRFKWDGTEYKYDGTLWDDLQMLTYYEEVEFNDTYAGDGVSIRTGIKPSSNLEIASGSIQFNSLSIDSQNPNTLYAAFSAHLDSRDPYEYSFGYFKFSKARTDEFLLVETSDLPWAEDVDPNALEIASALEVKQCNTKYARVTMNFLILSMAVDPNTPSTLWATGDNGVYRTTNDGVLWNKLESFVNVRAIFIDPINTVNVFVGSENGLHRTTNAGLTWKQIQSGLESHKTINSLGLTPGNKGTRRVFCGTTGGMFIGATSLDIQ